MTGQADDTSAEEEPRRRGVRIGLTVAAGVVVVVLLVGLAFLAFGGGDAPAPASLGATGDSSEDVAPGEEVALEGTWAVEAGDSFVVYRVGETIISIGTPSEAVGRTTAVTGEMVIGTSVESASFSADVTKLESDQPRRDGRLRTSGLETNTYTEASFEITEPIALPDDLDPGAVVDTSVAGELTMHDTTQPVEVPVQARWDGTKIEIAGSIAVQMADYGIDPPSIGGIVSVEDNGTVEFQLVLTKS
jgi:polyisoprenoid-binding protein YceI